MWQSTHPLFQRRHYLRVTVLLSVESPGSFRLVVVAAAGTGLIVQARYEKQQDAWNRAMTAASTFSNSPGIVEALKLSDPTARLQPLTEKARRRAGVDFIVVANREGIRYTRPAPGLIGKRV